MRLTDLDVRKLHEYVAGKSPPCYLIVVQWSHYGRAKKERAWWTWIPKTVTPLATAGW